jgi:glycosyltransferase involved in cell wall biosynthesis
LINGKQGKEIYVRDDVLVTVLYGKRIVDFRLLLTLYNVIRKWDKGIIHSNEYKSNIYALILKLMVPRMKTVTTVHGWVGNTRRGKWYCRIDRKAISFFDRVIAVSQALASRLQSEHSRDVTVIPNGIDSNYWKPLHCNDPQDQPTIGFVGRISYEKGWDLFVQSAALVHQAYPRVRFRVAGHGPDILAMKTLTETLGLSSCIEFCGAVDDMRSFYGSLTILLAPSRSEGLPIAQLEAMATGVPVVATRVGGVGELIRHDINGLLCEPGNTTEIALQATQLLNNKKKQIVLAETARRIIQEQYSNERMIEKLQTVYMSMY